MPPSRAIGVVAREERFVAEYMVDFNATQAAIRAGYKAKAAGAQAARLLKRASVQKLLAERKKPIQERLTASSETVLMLLLRAALGDIRALYHGDGRMKLPHELDDDSAAIVASMETVETEAGVVTRKMKRVDQLRAVEMLARHFGFFNADRSNAPVVDTRAADARAVTINAIIAVLERQAAGEIPVVPAIEHKPNGLNGKGGAL